MLVELPVIDLSPDRRRHASDASPGPAGFEEGRRAGFEQGRFEGQARGRAEGADRGRGAGRATCWPRSTAAVDDLHGRDAAALAAMSEEIVELVMGLATTILAHEVESDTSPGRAALDRALRIAPERGDLVARLHPDDIDSIGDVADLRGLAGDRTDRDRRRPVGRAGRLRARTPDRARIDAQVDRARPGRRAPLAADSKGPSDDVTTREPPAPWLEPRPSTALDAAARAAAGRSHRPRRRPDVRGRGPRRRHRRRGAPRHATACRARSSPSASAAPSACRSARSRGLRIGDAVRHRRRHPRASRSATACSAG